MEKDADGKLSLRDRLPAASDASLDALLSMLQPESKPSNGVFTVLLKDGCSPAIIQSVLIEYRDEHLNDDKLGDEQKRKVIRQSDRLSLLLLNDVATSWRIKVDDLESRLSNAGSELQMAVARTRWARDGEVTIYNYFHEVPVMARVAVHDVRESGFGVEWSPDLVHVMAAGEYGRFAHIRLSDLTSCLRLEVESVVEKYVNFRYAGTFKTAKERRQHIRVLCKDGLPLTLSRASGQKTEAIVQDISQSGFGLTNLDQCAVQVGDTFNFELELHPGKLKGTCQVRWRYKTGKKHTSDHAGHGRIGVEIDLTPALLHRLQLEVSRRVKRVLAELRASGAPDSLILGA